MTGPCAFCGAPDNEHRVTDAIVDRVIGGESLASVVDDFELYSAREVWLMTTATLSERLNNTRSKPRQERIQRQWKAFVDREGWVWQVSQPEGLKGP